jgi:hypothetical protein
MIRVVNPLMPSIFARQLPRMGQLAPLVPPTAAPSGIGSGLAATGAGLATLAFGSVSVLFMYGVAKESRSGLVKTTGYILAGVSALAVLIEAAAVGAVVYKATA